VSSHRAIRILGDKNEVSVGDGMFTFMIYGYFPVGLPVLFFSLGGLLYQAGVTLYSSCFFFLSFFLPLRFRDLGPREPAPGHCTYGTRMSKKEGWDDGRETGKFPRPYSRVEYFQREGKKLPWCLRHE